MKACMMPTNLKRVYEKIYEINKPICGVYYSSLIFTVQYVSFFLTKHHSCRISLKILKFQYPIIKKQYQNAAVAIMAFVPIHQSTRYFKMYLFRGQTVCLTRFQDCNISRKSIFHIQNCQLYDFWLLRLIYFDNSILVF